MDVHARTRLIIGDEALAILAGSRVIVAGLGGVGGAAVEALARSGVGSLVLVDNDIVEPSNLNRQIIATASTIGMPKARVSAARVREIAPGCRAQALEMFITPENVGELLTPAPDYLIDAVDNVTAKLAMAEFCDRAGIPIISCMGTGNKLDPTRFEMGEIWDTQVCPLSRVIRRELRKRGVSSLKVVYSDELPRIGEGRTPGSISFVPPVAGMIAAGAAVRDLIQKTL